mmetsp:Transcript_2247/g.7515  ORF Transcript_2247/g.7515 Transcript_2247/m.7515 type:complete len:206 (+) Transcript_2247:367-984(+)
MHGYCVEGQHDDEATKVDCETQHMRQLEQPNKALHITTLEVSSTETCTKTTNVRNDVKLRPLSRVQSTGEAERREKRQNHIAQLRQTQQINHMDLLVDTVSLPVLVDTGANASCGGRTEYVTDRKPCTDQLAAANGQCMKTLCRGESTLYVHSIKKSHMDMTWSQAQERGATGVSKIILGDVTIATELNDELIMFVSACLRRLTI